MKGVLAAGAGFLVLAYIAILAAFFVFQRSFLYFPYPVRIAPSIAGLPAAREVEIEAEDEVRLVAWHLPARDGRATLLHLHGNGDTLAGLAPRLDRVTRDGTGLLALAYRGYSGSGGRPSEAGLHRDARAAYGWLRAAGVAPERIVLWGRSLGTGVAVRLASDRPVAGLVLEAPYTAIVDVAARLYPVFPVRLLMSDQFLSREWIGAVRAPVLILHGARDGLIPIGHARTMHGLANEPKRLVVFEQGGHNDLDRHGLTEAVASFLSELPIARAAAPVLAEPR